eukprot:1195978-Prorocentrum_minimum.AAC.1
MVRVLARGLVPAACNSTDISPFCLVSRQAEKEAKAKTSAPGKAGSSVVTVASRPEERPQLKPKPPPTPPPRGPQAATEAPPASSKEAARKDDGVMAFHSDDSEVSSESTLGGS